MPRDDSAPSASTDANEAGPSGPLKKGDACLYCRRRRIKCSATKPSCNHCTKLRRECVYDSGKPVNRVTQLEERVAELEGMILKTGADASSSSQNFTSAGAGALPALDNASTNDPASISPTYYTLSAANLQQPAIDIHMLESYGAPSNQTAALDFDRFFPSYGDPADGQTQQSYQTPGIPHPVFPSSSNPGTSAERSFDFSTLDPNYTNLLDAFQNTSTGPLEQLQQRDFAYDGQSGAPPFTDPNMANPPLDIPAQSLGFTSADQQLMSSSISAGQSLGPAPSDISAPYQAYVTDIPDIRGESEQPDDRHDIRKPITIGISGDHPAPSEEGVKQVMRTIALHENVGTQGWRNFPENGMGMVGGGFDASDLPRVARDHLLELFFSGMRLVEQEIHAPRFYARLSMRPSKRPHPCLLYAMYLHGSRMSDSPPIRSLEPHFYSVAMRQLDEAVSHIDRLFDAVRAASILAFYKYSLSRYHEGWMMIGEAARLAVSCGLHQIKSNVYQPSSLPTDDRATLTRIMRKRTYAIDAPEDSIELGERIWAFWSIFHTDRCGAISSFFPPAFAVDAVTTPYPRPLPEYALGIVTEADDISLAELYKPRVGPSLPYYADATAYILLTRSLVLLDRCTKLIYSQPEDGWRDRFRKTHGVSTAFYPSPKDSSDDDNGNSSMQYVETSLNSGATRVRQARHVNKGWTRTAKIRTPKAYEEIRLALLQVEEDLPPERRTQWTVWDGKVPDWHYQPHRFKKEMFSLYFVIGCAWMFLFDVLSFTVRNDEAVAVARRLAASIRIASSERTGSEFRPFISTVWVFVCELLIREDKRLRNMNDPSVLAIESDIDSIVQALKVFGLNNFLSTRQRMRAERFRQWSFDDLAFLEDEDADDEDLGFL